jgi:hypothetical protein
MTNHVSPLNKKSSAHTNAVWTTAAEQNMPELKTKIKLSPNPKGNAGCSSIAAPTVLNTGLLVGPTSTTDRDNRQPWYHC